MLMLRLIVVGYQTLRTEAPSFWWCEIIGLAVAFFVAQYWFAFEALVPVGAFGFELGAFVATWATVSLALSTSWYALTSVATARD